MAKGKGIVLTREAECIVVKEDGPHVKELALTEDPNGEYEVNGGRKMRLVNSLSIGSRECPWLRRSLSLDDFMTVGAYKPEEGWVASPLRSLSGPFACGEEGESDE